MTESTNYPASTIHSRLGLIAVEGVRFEILDRKENFIRLFDGKKEEYVMQATKTSLDSYVSVLMMENKVVTKKVLERCFPNIPIRRQL